jgi:hypothetical protein
MMGEQLERPVLALSGAIHDRQLDETTSVIASWLDDLRASSLGPKIGGRHAAGAVEPPSPQ